MIVKRAVLNGFRNYEWETAEFSPDINIICGENAQGKTNLLEAIYIFSTGKSFRTRFDKEMIGFGYSSAEIMAEIFSAGRDQTIKISLQEGKPKKILINGVKSATAEMSGLLKSVLFCPDDLNIIKEGAAMRRKLLDNAISQLRPQYAEYLSQYNKYLDHKTRILRDWQEKPDLLDTLDDFSDCLCRLSAHIIRYRAVYSQRLIKAAGAIHKEFSDGRETLTADYKTVSTVTDPFASVKDIYYEIAAHQESHKKAEIDSGMCLTGAHKDDLDIQINGNSARTYASQGQTRTASLSLKLAERDILCEDTGETPLLLLDDVLSELDEKRQNFILNRIGSGQVFITCCEDSAVAGKTGGKIIRVSGGKLQ